MITGYMPYSTKIVLNTYDYEVTKDVLIVEGKEIQRNDHINIQVSNDNLEEPVKTTFYVYDFKERENKNGVLLLDKKRNNCCDYIAPLIGGSWDSLNFESTSNIPYFHNSYIDYNNNEILLVYRNMPNISVIDEELRKKVSFKYHYKPNPKSSYSGYSFRLDDYKKEFSLYKQGNVKCFSNEAKELIKLFCNKNTFGVSNFISGINSNLSNKREEIMAVLYNYPSLRKALINRIFGKVTEENEELFKNISLLNISEEAQKEEIFNQEVLNHYKISKKNG